MTELQLQKQRDYKLKSNNKTTKKYEKSINGFLMRTYRNMLSRISGVQKKKHHLYFGKDILEINDFYEWSKKNNSFILLFKEWELNNYERRKTPSIDRINSSLGYTLDNMQWITFSENCKRGADSRYNNGKIY